MRLYEITYPSDGDAEPHFEFAGTQAEARRLCRDTGASWRAVEVPTNKQGLIEFLNKL